MAITSRALAFSSLAALALTAAPLPAQSHSPRWVGSVHLGHPVHHHHGHRWHGRWGVGIGFGFGGWPVYPYGVYHPGYVVVEPAPVARVPQVATEPALPSPPDPVFTPRSGQSALQTEGDRQACNRAAMTQENALRDAAVFHQTVLACMERRGYSVR